MGIREKIDQNRAVSITVVAAILVGAAFIIVQMARSRQGEEQGASEQAFYSIDDGQNWFADDASKIPPFEHEGKTAYRVKVFKCPNGKPFVLHLERFKDDVKKRLDELEAKSPGGGAFQALPPLTLTQAIEVKKPGEKQWISLTPATTEQYRQVTQAKCPDGRTVGIEPVLPQ